MSFDSRFEFSVSGGGEGDYVTGTIIIDNFTLTGSLNQLTNPGFELPDGQDDGMGWGSAIGGGHAEVVTDPAMAYSGDNYLSIGVTDNWAVFYTEDTISCFCVTHINLLDVKGHPLRILFCTEDTIASSFFFASHKRF